ncbi:MAG: outer membrane protein transport protein [Deltaproteobacteria bacterium]|nr:outer membrane protein transport protein [Deltaproteobacteria bacterium]
MRKAPLRTAIIALCLQATVASAGGFEFPDHAATAMSRGGSAVAATEGTSAIYYNPAGLADLDGLQLMLDGELALMSTSFQRKADDGSGNFVNVGQQVSNSRNPWVAPFGAVSYQVLDGLTVGIAGYGPSAFAWQRYPDPRDLQPTAWDGDYSNDPTDYTATEQGAPQRYNLIDSSILLAFPSIAVAYRPVKWVSFGATGQALMGGTSFSMALYAGLAAGEDPASDAIGSLDVKARPTFTSILGLQVHPLDELSVGVSWRPGFTVASDGTLDLQFSDGLAGLAELLGQDLEQTGNTTTFYNDFPDVIRLGVAYRGKGWLAEIGGTYEGWSRVEAFDVTTDEIVVWMGDEQIEVPPISIPKNWDDTLSFRLGGAFALGELLGKDLPLTVRAGYVFETGAIPDSTMALDFISAPRNQLTLGASYDLGPITVNAAATRIFQKTVEVTTSEVPQVAAPPPGFPPYEGSMVGNGTYAANYTLFILGVEGHFLAAD